MSLKPVTGASVYDPNLSSPLSIISSTSNGSNSTPALGAPLSSSSSIANVSISFSVASKSSISTKSSPESYTLSWNFATSILSIPRLSSDQSIIIEPVTSPESAPVIQITDSKLSKWMNVAKDLFFQFTTPQPNRFHHPLNTVELEKRIKTIYPLLTGDHLFYISGFLSPKEVVRTLVTCQLWKQLLDEQSVWKQQCEIQGYIPLQGTDDNRFSPIAEALDYKALLAKESRLHVRGMISEDHTSHFSHPERSSLIIQKITHNLFLY